MLMFIVRWLTCLAVAIGACGGQQPSPQAQHVTKRAALPEELRDRVPTHGVFVWLAGGEGSELYTFDRDASTLKVLSARPGQPDEVKTKTLSAAEAKQLWDLAQAAWREGTPPPREPHLDYNETLAVGDGDATFVFDGGGSIETKAATAAIKAIVDAAR
jgi:hypothetical protein